MSSNKGVLLGVSLFLAELGRAKITDPFFFLPKFERTPPARPKTYKLTRFFVGLSLVSLAKVMSSQRERFCRVALAEFEASDVYEPVPLESLRRLNALGFATVISQPYGDSAPSRIGRWNPNASITTLGVRSQQQEYVSGWVLNEDFDRLERRISEKPLRDICHSFDVHKRFDCEETGTYDLGGLTDRDVDPESCVTRYQESNGLWVPVTFGCESADRENTRITFRGTFLNEKSPLSEFVCRENPDLRRVGFHSRRWGRPHSTFWSDLVDLFESVVVQ